MILCVCGVEENGPAKKHDGAASSAASYCLGWKKTAIVLSKTIMMHNVCPHASQPFAIVA
jgi:hypothetical protein